MSCTWQKDSSIGMNGLRSPPSRGFSGRKVGRSDRDLPAMRHLQTSVVLENPLTIDNTGLPENKRKTLSALHLSTWHLERNLPASSQGKFCFDAAVSSTGLTTIRFELGASLSLLFLGQIYDLVRWQRHPLWHVIKGQKASFSQSKQQKEWPVQSI